MDTKEETIKMAGFGRKKAMRKQIEVFEKEFTNGEELLGVGASVPNPTDQLYITNKRVIAHKIEGMLSNSRVEIPVSSISSVNTSTSLKGATLNIVASNNNATVEKIPVHVAQELKKVLDSLILAQAK